jgi:hypothetical protein
MEDAQRLGYTYDNGGLCAGRHDDANPRDAAAFAARWTSKYTRLAVRAKGKVQRCESRES